AIVLQAGFAIVYTLCTFLLFPYIVRLGAPSDLATEIFTISGAVVTIIWALGTVFLFIDLLVLAVRTPRLLQQDRVAPLPVLWASIAIGSIACILAIIGTLAYSWIPNLIPNTQWLIWVSGTTVGVVVVGVLFVFIFSAVSEGAEMWQTPETS